MVTILLRLTHDNTLLMLLVRHYLRWLLRRHSTILGKLLVLTCGLIHKSKLIRKHLSVISHIFKEYYAERNENCKIEESYNDIDKGDVSHPSIVVIE